MQKLLTYSESRLTADSRSYPADLLAIHRIDHRFESRHINLNLAKVKKAMK